MSISISHRVSDIPAEKVKYQQIDPKSHVGTHLISYEKNNCVRILQGTSFPEGKIFASQNGFVNSILQAYNQHHNIVIRPDDVWTAIVIQFSFYVNANAEEFRSKFVNFEGKLELAVCVPGHLDSAPYDLFVKLMMKKINKNLVDEEIKNWLLPNLSTTTEGDSITCGVVFMAAMQKYFHYRCICDCGIPSVTLEGTVEDWKKIKEKVQKLNQYYELSKWVDLLDPILDQFIKTKAGEPNLEFWQTVCKYTPLGSGGDSDLSGWITAFIVFNEEGRWRGDVRKGRRWPDIDSKTVTTGVVQVPVTIQDADMDYKAVMFAGHMAGELLDDGCTLQPRSGWVMVLKSEEGTPTKKAF